MERIHKEPYFVSLNTSLIYDKPPTYKPAD